MSGIFGNSLGLTRDGAAPAPTPTPLPSGTPADFVTETAPLVMAAKLARDLINRGILSFEQSMTAPLPWQKAAYAGFMLQTVGRALQGMGATIQGAVARRVGYSHPDAVAGQQQAAYQLKAITNQALRAFL